MKVLVLNHREVEQFLPMFECISAMEEAIAALARGETHQPLRTIFRPPEVKGVLAMMPSFRESPSPLFGLKAICVFPGNAAIGKDAHQGGVILFDGTSGEPLALINASAITAIRTAAVSALATKLLAREDASTLAIIGAGVQGRSHMKAIPVVREIREIRICSRTRAHADALARQASNARAVDSVHEAVRGADIIITATSSKEPILRREWIGAGIHINAVGSSVASSRELDSATMAAASLFVDRRESTVNESGDYLMAVRDGAITEDAIRAEIGDILIGRARGRIAEDEITLFKSLGIAIEDL